MKREVYAERKAELFLGKYVPVAKSQLVRRLDEISLPLPLVLKLSSPDVLHKSELQGVRIVKTDEELKVQFWALLHRARQLKIKLEGILVQEFVEGQELLIGIKRDATFGHVLTLGAGGIFTELLNDVSIRKCPITTEDAQEMMDELRVRQLFYGARGKILDREFLKKVLVRVSHIPEKHRNIQEMDINPFMLAAKGGKAVDARMVLQ